MRIWFFALTVFCGSLALAALAQQPAAVTTPETFTATARVPSGVTAPIQVHIQRYSPDFDRTAVETALKSGGYPAFLPALRKAPEVGAVELVGQTFTIRWARSVKTEKGRTIVVVTDKPVFFVGGGRPDAKPRAGYEVAVLELVVDDNGRGTGTMAAAARVKPGGPTGVQIDDYADEPVTLVMVARKPG